MRRRKGILALLVTGAAALLFAAGSDTRAQQTGKPAGALAATAAIAANGSLPMDVVGVLPTSQGNVVLLRVHGRDVYLPIWIGDAEALAIDNRLQGRQAPRPLTHDLLENMLHVLGARIVRVEVVALRRNTFFGEITLRETNGAEHAIDARSSDSIALGLGAG